jgi:hypothetical protein
VKENLACLHGNIADIDSDAAMQKCKIGRQSMLPIACLTKKARRRVFANPHFQSKNASLRKSEFPHRHHSI